MNMVLTGKAIVLEITAEYCNMSVADTAAMFDRHGQRLDDCRLVGPVKRPEPGRC